jgi:hypothetical protein
MMSIPIALLKVAGSFALAAGSYSPVAVIEDITGPSPGVELMDYVEAGQVIKLGQQDTVVIGYLKSCWRETITGGTVTVGKEQSNIQGGRVERSITPCDAGKMLLTAKLANTDVSEAAAFRAPPRRQAAPRPEFTLYGLSPVVEVKPNGTLVIERLDEPGERHEIALGADRLVRGAFFDTAKAGIALAAGGVYRVKAGKQEMVFKIDPGAASGRSPIAGRLIRLQPAS